MQTKPVLWGILIALGLIVLGTVGHAGTSEFRCDGEGQVRLAIEGGEICGTTDSAAGIWSYKGVPYAETTAGANRWLEAKPLTSWDGIQDATDFGPECSQLKVDQSNGHRSLAGSEDCLSVNVFTPVGPNSANETLAVMVFIHGGAFKFGTGGTPLFDGTRMAQEGQVVVVTMNYRLGVLGFLGGIDAGDIATGNLGLKDQQAALKWVHENIRHFGGDKDRVTVFGESAGASSVGVHLVNSESQKYIQQGIMESNHFGMLFQTLASAKQRARWLLKDVQCRVKDTPQDQLECLRQKADDSLFDFLDKARPTPSQAGRAFLCNSFGGFEYWAPILDGDFVKKQPVDTAISLPVLMGTNTNEGVLFAAIAKLYPEAKPAALRVAMNSFFGRERGKKVTQEYPALSRSGVQHGVALANVMTDYIWNCANNKVLAASAEAGNEHVYGYQFRHVPTVSLYPMGYMKNKNGQIDKKKPFIGNPCGPDASVNPDHTNNVCHGNELAYVFGNPYGYTSTGQPPAMHSFSTEENAMIREIINIWTDFAKEGSLKNIPKFTPSNLPEGEYWILQDKSEGGFQPTTQLYDDAKCDFWQNEIKYELSWAQKLCAR